MVSYISKIRLGVAQLVARYLGVVEAASSSLVTQTKKALETLRFPMLFSYPVTQLFGACYTICHAAKGEGRILIRGRRLRK